MATTGNNAFSQDGQYYAFCGHDGKLRVWDTASGRLKNDHTPNRHLSSPCNVLQWIYLSPQSTDTTSPSPWKRRRRKSTSEDADHKLLVAMGLSNGNIALFNIASATLTTLKSDSTAACTAITWSACSGLITATDDYHLVEWNLQEQGIKCKWKSGKSKVTALAVPADGKTLLSAERIIKWWDLTTKQLIRTFTGHGNQVTFLHPFKIDDTTSYLISSARMDNHLSIWLLDKHKNDKAPVASLGLQDETTFISTFVAEESQVVQVLAVTRSGQALLFKYQPNGRIKPLKPSLSINVISEDSKKQCPILAGHLTDDEKLLLAYNNHLTLFLEKVVPDFSEKVQCLTRTIWRQPKERTLHEITKEMPTNIDGNAKYILGEAASAATKRNRTLSDGSQLPLKDRLENLSLNDVNTPGISSTKGSNMAQLLMQALNSSDRDILTTVLFTKNESVIPNTVAKLPVQAIPPLLKELTVMLQGKTYACRVAVKWLQALIMSHAAHLLSRPDVTDMFGSAMQFIDAKLTLLRDIQKLKGRVSLVTGQISRTNQEDNNFVTQNAMLVYRDPGPSNEALDTNNVDSSSESDDNWEEMSEQNEENQQDEEGIKSVESDNDHSDSNDDDDDDDAMST